MIRVIHHRLGHQRWRGDVFERRNRAGTFRWAVHDGGIELDDALFVRQSADADGLIVRIELLDIHPRIERIDVVARHHLKCLGDAAQPICRSNHDRTRAGPSWAVLFSVRLRKNKSR